MLVQGARTLVNKGASGCTSSKTCGECEGDCDQDSDCKIGFECFQRNGKLKVPGCGGGGGAHDKKDYDFCVQKRAKPCNGATLHCSGTTTPRQGSRATFAISCVGRRGHRTTPRALPCFVFIWSFDFFFLFFGEYFGTKTKTKKGDPVECVL